MRKVLAKEMRGRIKEDDVDVPLGDGPWLYYSRHKQGGQHPISCRALAAAGGEEILLDGDALSRRKETRSRRGAAFARSRQARLVRRRDGIGALCDPGAGSRFRQGRGRNDRRDRRKLRLDVGFSWVLLCAGPTRTIVPRRFSGTGLAMIHGKESSRLRGARSRNLHLYQAQPIRGFRDHQRQQSRFLPNTISSTCAIPTRGLGSSNRARRTALLDRGSRRPTVPAHQRMRNGDEDFKIVSAPLATPGKPF